MEKEIRILSERIERLDKNLKILPNISICLRRLRGLELNHHGLEFPPCVALKVAEDVLDREIVALLVDHGASFKKSRSRSRPRRTRALMVPSGVASFSAICSWVKPPKKASSTTRKNPEKIVTAQSGQFHNRRSTKKHSSVVMIIVSVTAMP